MKKMKFEPKAKATEGRARRLEIDLPYHERACHQVVEMWKVREIKKEGGDLNDIHSYGLHGYAVCRCCV